MNRAEARALAALTVVAVRTPSLRAVHDVAARVDDGDGASGSPISAAWAVAPCAARWRRRCRCGADHDQPSVEGDGHVGDLVEFVEVPIQGQPLLDASTFIEEQARLPLNEDKSSPEARVEGAAAHPETNRFVPAVHARRWGVLRKRRGMPAAVRFRATATAPTSGFAAKPSPQPLASKISASVIWHACRASRYSVLARFGGEALGELVDQ